MNSTNNNKWEKITGSPDFAALETEVMEFWKNDDIFGKTLDKTANSPEYIFYDGPPFANGLPHYGHLLTSCAKDTDARFRTMTGHHVRRVWGWDCHGLPAEMAAEKALGVSGRKAIEEYGIENFNNVCKTDVMKYANEWKKYIDRIGRWVDMDNAYKTMDTNFMESILWAFKALYDKGLVYKELRVAPYSWACQTALSNFETRLDNSYRQKESKSVIVKFKIIPNEHTKAVFLADAGISINSRNESNETSTSVGKTCSVGSRNIYILVWTTTPWTLPSNLALAVNKDLDYEYVVTENGDIYIANGIGKFFGSLGLSSQTNLATKTSSPARQSQGEGDLDKLHEMNNSEILASARNTIRGSDLIGLSYEPLFSYFVDTCSPANYVREGDLSNFNQVQNNETPTYEAKTNKRSTKFHIYHGDFVTAGDGTGVVHVAPGFGEEDFNLCKELGIEAVVPVDDDGKFTNEIPDFAGMHVFEANDEIIKKLKIQGNWVKTDQYLHQYPHCWRTDTPIIYKAMPSYYIKVEPFRDRLCELNQEINWIPGNVKDGIFGNWLAGARDWAISRNRFFGTPLPIWISTDPNYPCEKVFGSITELEEYFAEHYKKQHGKELKIADLHRPFIDTLIAPNPNDPTGQSELRRVPDVFDCWFESGAMPFAEMHYPFAKDSERPAADFIVEYTAQTRGWFYTLHVLSTLLFDRPAFKNCICHGVILDDKGQKLSKRLGNYIDPIEAMDEYGADALRHVMLSSNVMKGGELLIDKDGRMLTEVIKCVHKPLWSALNFFMLYASEDQPEVGVITLEQLSQCDIKSKASEVGVAYDFFILLRAYEFAIDVHNLLSAYNISDAYDKIRDFIDDLNNLYIRRSRDRFWGAEMDDSKQRAYSSLYTALYVFAVSVAPLMPYFSEIMFQALVRDKVRSVHMEDCLVNEGVIKVFNNIRSDYAEFLSGMNLLKKIFYAGRSIRDDKLSVRMRQPLPSATIFTNLNVFESFKEFFIEQIKDELNVKHVDFLDKESAIFGRNLKLNSRLLGPRFGKDIMKLKAQIDAGNYELDNVNKKLMILYSPAGIARKGDLNELQRDPRLHGENDPTDKVTLEQNEFFLDVQINKEHEKTTSIAHNENGDYIIVKLDDAITPALAQEGIMRDIVRSIQDARKSALSIADRIELYVWSEHKAIYDACEAWRDYIMHETLAEKVEFKVFADSSAMEQYEEAITKNDMMIFGYSALDSLDKKELDLKLSFKKI